MRKPPREKHLPLGPALLACVLPILCSCDDSTDSRSLPPLPSVDTAALEPVVRDQLAAARAAVLASPESSAENGRLGMVFHAYGWLAEARDAYERAARLDPGGFRWWYCLGCVQLDSGESVAGRLTLERAATLNESYHPLLIRLGRLALERGRPGEAGKWFTKALAAEPGSPYALEGLGEVAFAGDRLDEAVELHSRALEAAPRFARAAYNLALAHRASGDLESARRFFAHHGRSDKGLRPEDPILDAVLALAVDSQELFGKANSRLKAGRPIEAIELYRDVLEHNPDMLMAEYNIGLALQQLGRHRDALPHYERVLERRPDNLDALNNLGLCHFELEAYSEAAVCFERALAIEPGYYKAHFNLGLTRMRQRNAIAAARHFRDALAIRPGEPEARLNLGVLCRALGEPEAAVGHFLEVLAVRPRERRVIGELLREFARHGDSPRRRLAAFLEEKRLFETARFVREAPLERGGESKDEE